MLGDVWRQMAPTLLAFGAAYCVSFGSWIMFWLIRNGCDPNGDTGIGAFMAMVAADLIVVMDAVAETCFDLTWLFDNPPAGYHRTLAFLLLVCTMVVSVPALIIQGVMLCSFFTSVHLLWIVHRKKWEMFL